MEAIRKITANLPRQVLRRAMKVTGKNQTTTLVMGLEELLQRRTYEELRSLRGKLSPDLDLSRSRRSRV